MSTGVTFSKQIAFEQSASLPPRVVLGLNLLDISSQANYRVRSFVDNVTTTDLVAHIDSWNNTAFVNGAISWLKLSASDPAFQCGDIAATGSPTPQRVPFNWQFDVQPTVLVALSGFDIGNDPQLSVSATNIDRTGFTLQVETGRNTSFNSCNVSWVAFPTGKRGISFGTFGGNSQTSTEYSGTLDFTPSAAFKRPPQVFTTLTKLDADPSRNLRVQITTSNVSENGMSWKVATWGDSILWNVQGAYLAIEPGLLE